VTELARIRNFAIIAHIDHEASADFSTGRGVADCRGQMPIAAVAAPVIISYLCDRSWVIRTTSSCSRLRSTAEPICS
jgi:hypothetical protein